VVIYGYLTAGSIFDSDERLGLADFTAAALMRGTHRSDFYQIYDRLETAGASLGISGGVNSMTFSGRALAEDLAMLLATLSEVLCQPAFPVEHVERLRAEMLTGLAIRDQDTADMAGMTFDKIVYDQHPYSRPEDGYPETVAEISQSDLHVFHRQYFGPSGMVIAIVGAVDPIQAVELVGQFLGAWQNPDQILPPIVPAVSPMAEVVTRKVRSPGKFQADLLIGAAGPSRLSDDYLAATLGNNVLGQFGMMGRIGLSVREEAGLAYHAYSNLIGGVGPGPWYVAAGVDPENVDRVVGIILAEVRRFVEEPVSEDELGDSQAQFIGSMPLSLESNAGVAAALVSIERYALGLDYFDRLPGLIIAITPGDVLEVSKSYLDPKRIAIAVAGP